MAEHTILPPIRPRDLGDWFPKDDLFAHRAADSDAYSEEEEEMNYYGPHIDISDIQGYTLHGEVENQVKQGLDKWDRRGLLEEEEAAERAKENNNNVANERMKKEYEINRAIVERVPDIETLRREAEDCWPNVADYTQRVGHKGKQGPRGPDKNILPAAVPSAPPSEEAEDDVDSKVSPDDAILNVAIYHYKDAKKRQEFLVLGSQSLSVLRDRIYCLLDHDDTFRVSHSSGAYFYIEGITYDDCRPESTGDRQRTQLSQPVIEWTRGALTSGKVSGWGLIDSQPMEHTKFSDLNIRLGAHYLYCHQGDCQHIVVFTDLRSVTDYDELNTSRYPIHTYQTQLKRTKCAACPRPAECLCYGDRFGPSNPTYYCSQCFHRLHYTPEGEVKAGSFKVYPYYHD